MKRDKERAPLSDEEKAAYARHVKDKTRPLRTRFFAEACLKVLFALGVTALAGYGGFSLWSLVYAKDKADQIEQKMQEKVRETQRDLEQ